MGDGGFYSAQFGGAFVDGVMSLMLTGGESGDRLSACRNRGLAVACANSGRAYLAGAALFDDVHYLLRRVEVLNASSHVRTAPVARFRYRPRLRAA